MKLIFNSSYDILDEGMTDSNIEGRKGKNMRNHIFVLRSIMQEVLKNKKKSIDLQFMDMKQCFDSIDLREVIIDLFEAGLNNDLLHVIYEANRQCQISVKTPVGLSDEKTVGEIWMQGDVLASLGCSIQVDKFAKEYDNNNNNFYKYKNKVKIPAMLGFVDDILGIQKCGSDAKRFNNFINQKICEKKLQSNIDKCSRLHIGSKVNKCEELEIDCWNVKKHKDAPYEDMWKGREKI